MNNKNEQLSKNGKKTIGAGKEVKIIEIKGDGHIQSLVLKWSHASADITDVTIQVNLGKNGSFTVNFQDYNEAGILYPVASQDFWVSRYDTTDHNFALSLSPSIALQFKEKFIVLMKNNSESDATLDVANAKYFEKQ